MSTLGEELPKEMARVRDDVLPLYDELGNAGAWGAAAIRRDLDIAARVLAEGDVVGMLHIYKTLREVQ